MNRLYKLSIRYLCHNMKRTVMTIFGVTFSTILIFLILNLGNGVPESSNRMNYIENGSTDLYVIFGEDTGSAEDVDNVDLEDATSTSYKTDISKEDLATLQKIIDEKDENGISNAWYSYLDSCEITHISDFSQMKNGPVVELGVFPKNSNEIISASGVSGPDGQKLGVGSNISVKDMVSQEEKNFHVTGRYKSLSTYGEPYGLSLVDQDTLGKSPIVLHLNFKDTSNFMGQVDTLISKYNLANVMPSPEALYLSGEEDSGENIVWNAFLGIIIFFFSFFIIILIRNSFNISVTERMSDYGMLRCIGLTRKQIIKMIFTESMVISAIGASIGIVLGCLIDWIVIHNISTGGDVGRLYLMMNDIEADSIGLDLLKSGETVKFEILPFALLATLLLVFVFTAYSMVSPIQKLMKLSPVSALRQEEVGASHKKNLKKMEKKMTKRGRLISKVFGFRVGYAYKNITRKKGRFLGTVISLAMGIMVISFVGTATQSLKNTLYPMDSMFNCVASSDGKLASPTLIKDFESLDLTSKGYNAGSYYINRGKLREDEEETRVWVEGYSHNIMKKFQSKLIASVKPEDYQEDAIQVYCVRSVEGTDRYYVDKIGSTLEDEDYPAKLQIIGYINNTDLQEMLSQIEGISSYGEVMIPNFIFEYDPNNAVDQTLFPSQEFMNQHYSGSFKENKRFYTTGLNIFALADGEKENTTFTDFCNENGLEISMNDEVNTLIRSVRKVVYSIIFFVLLIVIVNTINVQSADIFLRTQEFRLLSFIGMSQKEERKLIVVENLLTSMIAFIPATLIGIWLGYKAIFLFEGGFDGIPVNFGMDWISIIVTFAMMILTSFLMARINKPKYLLEE